ncbi:glycosyltransferase family 4 protein [Pseudomonas sp. Hp2]|uniref:glycosyltransferase family 4 protein n=1 Tax=Pseudomonas sp. Hp2 TaxID=701189 RepID=UPI001126FDAD|nr:glycosyltransferase family 1 protein [Pseudomonas sp. Hp2]
MKILLDLQGAQTQSRRRGIGRFTREVTKALLRQASGHDVHLMVTSPLDEAIDDVIAEFRPCVSKDRFHYLRLPYGTSANMTANNWLNRATSRLFRQGIDSLGMDVVWHHSLFEGYDEDAVIPDRKPSTASAATLYDLIPLHDPEGHLPGTLMKLWHRRRASYLADVDTLFSISEWSAKDATEKLDIDPSRISVIGAGVDAMFRPARLNTEEKRKLFDLFGIHSSYILYNGGFDPRKNVSLLLEAFAQLPVDIRRGYQLVLVGDHREAQKEISRTCSRIGLVPPEVVLTGRVSDTDLVALYSECSLFVFPSFMEGFGLPVIEAMACGAPTLCSHATSLPEVAGRNDMLFSPTDSHDLCARMVLALTDGGFTQELREHGLRRAADFTWDAVAKRALAGLEALHERRNRSFTLPGDPIGIQEDQIIADIAAIPATPARDDLAQVAFSLCMMRTPPRPPQWLVDVSSIAIRDIGTGTHRVTRSILGEWLRQAPTDARIAPIRLQDGLYHYAGDFSSLLLGEGITSLKGIACAYPGDTFVGLDWAPEAVNAGRSRLQEWRRGGINTCFVVHDLLPMRMPERFHPHSCELFDRWLRNVAYLADNIACVSATTASDLSSWLDEGSADYQFRVRPAVTHFTLGATFVDRPVEASAIRASVSASLHERPSLLVVGTLEPRKGHEHALRICEFLWSAGHDINLIVVGRRGWSDEALANRLTKHEETGRRLFWLNDAEDNELSALYSCCTALLALSEGEGYGLPLLEAAHHGLPVIARSLPVFREIMGDYPYYLDNDAPPSWPSAVAEWLLAPSTHISPTSFTPLSWAESADQLASLIRNMGSRDGDMTL